MILLRCELKPDSTQNHLHSNGRTGNNGLYEGHFQNIAIAYFYMHVNNTLIVSIPDLCTLTYFGLSYGIVVLITYCKLGNVRVGFIFAKLRGCFMKINPSRNDEITHSLSDVGK